jgi:uncharacterized protein (UPF0218 family)
MRIVYSLTPEMRAKLKEPIGTLIRGSFAETTKMLKDIAARENPLSIITVGDTVSRNLNDGGFSVKLSIVDNLAMRKNIRPVLLKAEKTVHVRNPQATITDEAIEQIQRALRGQGSMRIVVDGEEDLLTLVTVLYAPENSYVIYGQPREGIVLVRVTEEKKQEVAALLEAMGEVRKAK